MGEVINLNKFRKAKARADKTATAAQNRLKHGRTATEKAQAKAQRDKLTRDLDNRRLTERDPVGAFDTERDAVGAFDDDDDKQPA